MNSHSLPAQEVDYLEQNSSDGTPSGMSSGTITASESSPKESRTDSSLTPQYSGISEHSPVQDVRSFIEALRMSSPQASPVSHSPSPENKREWTTSGICGRQQPKLLGLSAPDSYCLKMCPESVVTCPWLSETCADLGMKFQDPSSLGLMTLGRPTDENECGLWRTPSASEADHGGPNARDSKGGLHLSAQVMWPTMRSNLTGNITPNRCNDKFNNLESVLARQMWPTPRSGKTTDEKEETFLKRQKDGKVSTPPLTLAVKMWPTPKGLPSGPDFARMNRDGSGGDDLATAVARTWPTPAATDGQRGGKMTENMTGQSLTQMVNTFPTPKQMDWKGKTQRGTHAPMDGLCNTLDVTGGQLNPDWVEWLMGWPIGWSSLEPLTELRWLDWSVDPADVECEYDSVDDSDYTFPRTNKRLPAGASRPTKPMIGRVTRKVAHRRVRLKALGNGQVPAVVATAWELLTVSN